MIAEPSPVQFRGRLGRELLRRSGLLGLYFFLVANWMHEPFVQGWHRRDVRPWLDEHGFALVEDETGMPIRFITAIRDAARCEGAIEGRDQPRSES